MTVAVARPATIRPPNRPDRMGRLLLAGCGDLGVRLAGVLDRAGSWQATGLRRSPQRLPNSIRPFAADLLDPGSLKSLDRDWDAVVYTATPSERSEAGYRATYLTGLAHLLERIRTPRLVVVSSTAVYGQDGGEWVDERSPTEPNRFNGRILLQAESMARAAGGQVLRLSGIYGPGRERLIRTVREGGVECRKEPPVWTNRIHADDAAAALAHLIGLDDAIGDGPPVWIASDERPATRWDVLSWLAGRLGVPGPIETQDKGGQGKRVSSARLRATGFALQYPDFRAGYEGLLA